MGVRDRIASWAKRVRQWLRALFSRGRTGMPPLPLWRRLRYWPAVCIGVFAVALALWFAVPALTRLAAPPPPVPQPPVPALTRLQDTSAFGETGAFTVKAGAGVDRAWLMEHLYMVPEADFFVSVTDAEDVFRVSLRVPGRYRLMLDDPAGGEPQRWRIGGDMLLPVAQNESYTARDGVFAIRFSEPVDAGALREAVRLTPAVDFSVRCEGNTAYIIPHDTLRYGTEYTVTIGKGLASRDETTLFRNTTMRFETEPQPVRLMLLNPAMQIAPGDAPVELSLTVSLYGRTIAPVDVAVYRYGGAQAYLQYSQVNSFATIDTALLELVDRTTYQLGAGQHELMVPNPGVGYYLIEVTSADEISGITQSYRKMLSSTDLSVYVQTMDGQVLAWLNSTDTGGPVAGYTVELLADDYKTQLARMRTDKDGVAVASGVWNNTQEGLYDDLRATSIVTVRDSGGALVYVDDTGAVNWGGYPRYDQFHSTLYLDRTVYRSTDEVHFWGVVQPYADNKIRMPRTVEVALRTWEGVVSTQMVAIDANGVYSGVVVLDNAEKGALLRVRLHHRDYPGSSEETGFVELHDQRLAIYDYSDIEYRAVAQTNRPVYDPGDKPTLTIDVALADGTPAADCELNVHVSDDRYFNFKDIWFDGRAPTVTVRTDAAGRATLILPTGRDVLHNSDEPGAIYYCVTTAENDRAVLYSGRYDVWPDNLLVAGSFSEQGDYPVFTLRAKTMSPNTLSQVQTRAVQRLTDRFGFIDDGMAREYDRIPGVPYNTTVTYDAQIVTLKRGETRYATRELDGQSVRMMNGELFLYNLLPGPLSDYLYVGISIDVYVTDNKGNTKSYEYRNWSYRSFWDFPNVDSEWQQGYHWLCTDETGNIHVQSVWELDNVQDERTTRMYALERDDMRFTLQRDGRNTPNDGRILYTVLQEDKILEWGVTTESTITLTQQLPYANSILFAAAYFDGVQLHVPADVLVYFDGDSLALDVDAAVNQDRYEPGDEVTLPIRITNIWGEGVAASGVVSVAREEVFAIDDQGVGPIYDLHGSILYSSGYLHGLGRFAGGSGDVFRELGVFYGGDDGESSLPPYPRDTTRDTAAFIPFTTDANGHATVSFTLPGDIALWRVTTLAVTPDLRAGHSVTNLEADRDFYIEPVLRGSYAHGENVNVWLAGRGFLLSGSADVEITATLHGSTGYYQVQTVRGAAFAPQLLDYGALPAGDYTLGVFARYGAYTAVCDTAFTVTEE